MKDYRVKVWWGESTAVSDGKIRFWQTGYGRPVLFREPNIETVNSKGILN